MRSCLRYDRHPVKEYLKRDRAAEFDGDRLWAVVGGHDDRPDKPASVGSQIPAFEVEAGLVHRTERLHLVKPPCHGEVVGHNDIVRTATRP